MTDLDALTALLAAATPGPWTHHHNGESVRFCDGRHASEKGCSEIGEAEILGVHRDQAVANTALIVAMHSALPSLIVAARREAGLREALEQVLLPGAWQTIRDTPGMQATILSDEHLERLRSLLHDNAGTAER